MITRKVNGKSFRFRHITTDEKREFCGNYKGFEIHVYPEDWDDEDDERGFYARAFNSEISFGTAVDGHGGDTIDEAIWECIDNINFVPSV
ncbi:hypothetical protein [Larkinella terrae]|uniref:Uncharacterized protein n=1 Tax=Larkinella terrae TaxID=2025311 RepID=A0A7K0EK17_9BACT|nr:hypothetical protein [Larkinella terrae]MRS61798.1 hypothetical protein [Larkinella terrae]